MRKKILIAVDRSIHSREAMAYAAQLSGAMTGLDVDLYHVQPMISHYLMEEAARLPKARAELNRISRQNNEAALGLLESCREQLAGKLKDATIKTITRPRQYGIARDITQVAEEGLYDAVLVGRRGLTGLQEKILGSVTANLLSNAREIPVWVVDGQVSPGGVLIAVDGGSCSLRAVDHVGHMLSGNREVEIGLVNVEPELGDFYEVGCESAGLEELADAIHASNERRLADFRVQALGILERAGIHLNVVTFFNVKRKLFTRRALLNIFRKKGYSTLVVGKTGIGQNPNMGRVTIYLAQRVTNAALWVVP